MLSSYSVIILRLFFDKDILFEEYDNKYILTAHLWDYLQNYAAKHKAAGNGFEYGMPDLNRISRTLSARYYKDGSEILINRGEGEVPRRLTPRECARLQGFPDWWCDGIGTPDPSEDDIAKWREIFETHAKAIGKTTKPKSDAQIRKWLQNPQSDSAEYKMWGNGVALPNVFFVLAGIKYYSDLSQK